MNGKLVMFNLSGFGPRVGVITKTITTLKLGTGGDEATEYVVECSNPINESLMATVIADGEFVELKAWSSDTQIADFAREHGGEKWARKRLETITAATKPEPVPAPEPTPEHAVASDTF